MPLRTLIPLAMALALAAPAASADPLQSLLAGEFDLQSGRHERAAGHYLDAALASDDVSVAERATRIALLAGEQILVARGLVRWRELDPKAQALLQIEASLALMQMDLDGAVAALSSLLEGGTPGEQLALQVLASEQSALPAGLALRQLIERDVVPAVPDLWVGLGLIARRHQQHALSLNLAQRAAERFPEEARMRIWLAEEQLRAGSLEIAQAELDRALAMGELEGPMRMSAAALLERLGRSARAAELLARGPQDDSIIGTRAALLARSEQEDALLALYAEVKGLDKQPPPARRLLLGQLAELVERDAEALDWYGGVVELPHRARAQLRVAVLLARGGDLDRAQRGLRDLQLDAEADGEAVRDAYLLEAELLLREQREDEALSAYARGLEIFEDDPRLRYARALLLERLDRVDEAIGDFEALVELDPENPDHLNALGYTLADRTERYEEALELIERALSMRPDSAAIIDSHGWALYRLGRLEEAAAELRRAFELQPDAEIAAHLGEVLWKLEQFEEARAVWEQGRAADAENRVLLRTLERLLP
jgi:tetratricopeptide (TPR) repeat protein